MSESKPVVRAATPRKVSTIPIEEAAHRLGLPLAGLRKMIANGECVLLKSGFPDLQIDGGNSRLVPGFRRALALAKGETPEDKLKWILAPNENIKGKSPYDALLKKRFDAVEKAADPLPGDEDEF